MNLWGLNGGLVNLFGRSNGGNGLSGALVPMMSGAPSGSINGSAVGGGLNGKGSLPSASDSSRGSSMQIFNLPLGWFSFLGRR